MILSMNKESDAGLANFIIGGTDKAGTTSVFTYLSAHPSVCGSVIKETNFFRDYYTGDREVDVANYTSYFGHCAHVAPIVMEASPVYLAGGAEVAVRVHALIPQTKLLFIL